MALDFFRAEAGKTYKSNIAGTTASFTAEQLAKDPSAGMLPTDYVLQATGAAQSPSIQQDVSGVRSMPLPQFTSLSSGEKNAFSSSNNQTSPSASPKDVNVITSIDANQRVADSRQAANTGLTQLEQDQSRIEMEQAQKAERERKRFNEEAALKQALSGVEATQLANQFAEQQRTRGAAEFKLGQTGTYYQENAGDKAKQEYEGQVYRLNLQDQILQSQIARAYENNNVTLANELRERKDALVKNAQLAQDEAFNRMIKMTDLDSKLSKDADTAFEQIAKGGIELDSEDIKLLEEKYNLPQGMGEVKLRAYQKEAERQNIKDSNEARKADFDIASNITTMLSKIPMGQSIVIGGQEYMGLDRGNIKTGTETNSETGEVTFWEYNPLSGQTKTTSLGQIGTSRDGWETKFDDNGQPWRLNPTSGQMLPFYPTRAQQDIQAILPEGSVSPFLDENGNPRIECGAFTNDLTGLGVGDSYESKMEKMNLWTKGSDEPVESIIDKIQVGDGFTQKLNTWTGHVGMVLGVEKGPNGVMGIRAFESNYIPGKVTSTRFVPLSEIDGFGRGPTLHPLLKSGPDSQRNFASPTQSAGEPSVAPSISTSRPTFGAKKPEEQKPLSLTELEKVNEALPDDKKLQPGATLEDVKASGYRPQAPTKPATVDESKNAGYALRVREAMDIFENLEDDIVKTSTGKQLIQRNLPNVVKSDLFQQQEQAERNFINAVLRRESGAAIAPSEFDNAQKQYFPQPGDSKLVLEQKKANRATALQGLVIGSGSALSEDFKKNTQGAQQSVVKKTPTAALLDVMNSNPALKEKILAARKANYSDEEIAAKLGLR